MRFAKGQSQKNGSGATPPETPRSGLPAPLPVSIRSASYSLEKNQESGGDITSFRNQARTCTGSVHID